MYEEEEAKIRENGLIGSVDIQRGEVSRIRGKFNMKQGRVSCLLACQTLFFFLLNEIEAKKEEGKKRARECGHLNAKKKKETAGLTQMCCKKQAEDNNVSAASSLFLKVFTSFSPTLFFFFFFNVAASCL